MRGCRKIVLLLWLVLFSLGGCDKREFPSPQRWNVLWIVIDDLNVHHLGCYGYARGISPDMDGIARKGLRFEYCITQAPWTLPSFASMLSSLYPYELVLTREYLRHIRAETKVARSRDPYRMPEFNYHWYCPVRKDVKLFAEMLKQAGFETFAWTNNYWLQPEVCGLQRGFDVYHYTQKTDKYYLSGEEILRGTGDWIEEKKDKRWFAFVHLMEPHIPYHDHPGISLGESSIDRYDAEIAYMDKEIGEFFSRLKKLGLLDRTVIVVNADHGEIISPDRTRTLGHGVLTVDVMRVPLLFYYPGCKKGGAIKEVVRNLDIMPTLLEILKVESLADLQGKSLVPLLEGRNESDPRPAFSMAAFSGPEKISLLLDDCMGVLTPAHYKLRISKFMKGEKDCKNVEGVRLELIDFQKEVENFLSTTGEQHPIKIDPEDRKKLEALGYFK
jgi:arylsulfatase A-like enzyme